METKQEHLGHAVIGLCMMCLATTLFHIYTTSKFFNPDKPRTRQEDSFFAAATMVFFMVMIITWIFGLCFWVEQLGLVSVIQRNNSLIAGLGAANVGLVWTYLCVPSANIHTYAAYSLCPAYLGLVIGSLADIH